MSAISLDRSATPISESSAHSRSKYPWPLPIRCPPRLTAEPPVISSPMCPPRPISRKLTGRAKRSMPSSVAAYDRSSGGTSPGSRARKPRRIPYVVIRNGLPSAMAARRISSVLLSGVMNSTADRDQAGSARTRSTQSSLPAKSAMNDEKSQWNLESGRATSLNLAHTSSRRSCCGSAGTGDCPAGCLVSGTALPRLWCCAAPGGGQLAQRLDVGEPLRVHDVPLDPGRVQVPVGDVDGPRGREDPLPGGVVRRRGQPGLHELEVMHADDHRGRRRDQAELGQ